MTKIEEKKSDGMPSKRLQSVLAAIDEINRQDPNQVHFKDELYPKELLYSRYLTDWVLKLDPVASEWLRIAARGQHIQRWKIPRHQYPTDRGGYLRWREALKRFHTETLARIMKESGYSDPEIEKVKVIVLKKDLKNPDTQTIEDSLCLVFLETQFSALRQKTSGEKMRIIVQKTWRKMSQKAQDIALRLPLDPADHKLLQETLF